MHLLDLRVTKMELQSESHTEKLVRIDKRGDETLSELRAHIAEENRLSTELAKKVSWTLFSVLVAISAFFGQELFARVFK